MATEANGTRSSGPYQRSATNPRSIDVVIATCKRPAMLVECLDSVLRAARSTSLHVGVIVVDNGLEPTAEPVVRALDGRTDAVRLLHEPVSGKSRALNLGLQHTRADLIGYIDDDELLTENWFQIVSREFADPSVDFIGGPYVPHFETEPPPWLPPMYPAVIGATDTNGERAKYHPDVGPVLMGGNAVVRRSLQSWVGQFDVTLGPSSTNRQLTGEDHDMFLRYLAAGANGWFVPELRIMHHVPSSRLQRSYFRSYVGSHGIAQARLDRRQPQAVRRFLGVPRYRLGNGLRACFNIARSTPALRFEAELQIRECYAFVREHIRLRLDASAVSAAPSAHRAP